MDIQASSLEDAVTRAGNDAAQRSASPPWKASPAAIWPGVCRRCRNRTRRKNRTRQHSPNGRSLAKGGRHIPELLQSQGDLASSRFRLSLFCILKFEKSSAWRFPLLPRKAGIQRIGWDIHLGLQFAVICAALISSSMSLASA